MNKYILPVLFALFSTIPAYAETPMSGAEFDAYTRGKTLTYMNNGEPYGIEQYLSRRRVNWAFSGDDCKYGDWYEASAGTICFIYEDNPNPQCWQFLKTEGGLKAQFIDDSEGAESDTQLYEAKRTTEPLICLGPEVGV